MIGNVALMFYLKIISPIDSVVAMLTYTVVGSYANWLHHTFHIRGIGLSNNFKKYIIITILPLSITFIMNAGHWMERFVYFHDLRWRNFQLLPFHAISFYNSFFSCFLSPWYNWDLFVIQSPALYTSSRNCETKLWIHGFHSRYCRRYFE